jgi:hypothetical protein
VRSWPALLCALALCAIAVAGARPTGDGAEYLLVAHALATHASPDLRKSDADWLGERIPRLSRVAHRLASGIDKEATTPISTVRRATNGAYYPLHFWLYSLLGAPCLWLTELMGTTPARALGLLNGLAASVAELALFWHYGRGRFGLAAACAFALCGTTFYLGWTGPEALTGAAIVCACLPARRAELGLGCCAAAVAAAQNASAAALVPYVVWYWWRARRSLSRRDLILLPLAFALLVLPYAFFYVHFRIPSLLAHYATDPSLISGERAWSFVFDLNQGLVYGIPGLLLGVAVAIALAFSGAARNRRTLIADVAATVAVVAGMAGPTLAVHNWNPGTSVLLRYGYWTSLPLLVLMLELLSGGAARARWATLAAVAVVQVAVILTNGICGERYSYVRHTWLAQFVLGRFPGAYNPVPEIFFERSLGWEAPPARAVGVAWPSHGAPTKVLALKDKPLHEARICPDGGEVTSGRTHVVSHGWVYLDRPFGCR